MKISGLSCETKKIFLVFLGHPIVHDHLPPGGGLDGHLPPGGGGGLHDGDNLRRCARLNQLVHFEVSLKAGKF